MLELPQNANIADSKGSRPQTRVRWKIFFLMWVLVLINFVDRASLSIALPLIGEEFDLSPEMKGWILSSFFWTYALAQIPGGWLLDRLGPRRIVAWSAALWGGFQALAGAATGSLFLLFTRLGLGAAEAPMFPAGAKLNSTWLPARERARGATFLDSGGPLGAAIGGLVIAALITALGSWRLAFVVAGVGTIVAGLLVYRYVRNDPAHHPAVSESEIAYIRAAHAGAVEPGQDIQLPRVRQYFRSPSFWGLMAGRIGWTLIFFGMLTWGPQYLADTRGLDIKGLGFAMFAIFGAAALGELAAGAVADRWQLASNNRNLVMKTLLAISGCSAFVAIIALQSVSSAMAAVALLITAMFFLMWGGLYWAFPAQLSAKGHVGLVGGMMNFAGVCGGIVAPIVIGYLVTATGGYAAAITFFAGCAVLYTVGSMTINFHRPLARRPEAEGATAQTEMAGA
jgi:ACS family D-galactonate transporter-like MFS transporter